MDTQGWTCSERQGQNIQGRQLLRCLPVIPRSGCIGPCVITSLGWPGKLFLKNMAKVMGHPPEIRLQRLWFHLAHPLSLSLTFSCAHSDGIHLLGCKLPQGAVHVAVRTCVLLQPHEWAWTWPVPQLSLEMKTTPLWGTLSQMTQWNHMRFLTCKNCELINVCCLSR